MPTPEKESQNGLFCQALSTRRLSASRINVVSALPSGKKVSLVMLVELQNGNNQLYSDEGDRS